MQQLLLEVWQTLGTTVLFVTHDIDGSILLADRICIMSARPGRITCEIVVGLPRPRSIESLTTPAFAAYKAENHGGNDDRARWVALDPNISIPQKNRLLAWQIVLRVNKKCRRHHQHFRARSLANWRDLAIHPASNKSVLGMPIGIGTPHRLKLVAKALKPFHQLATAENLVINPVGAEGMPDRCKIDWYYGFAELLFQCREDV